MNKAGRSIVLAIGMLVALVVPPGTASAAPAAGAVTPGGGLYVRAPAPAVHSSTMPAHAVRQINLPNVPAGAPVSLAVSVAAPATSGSVDLRTPGGSSAELAAVTFAAGQSTSSTAVLPASASRTIEIRNDSGGSVQVRVDVDGYYTTGSPTTAGAFGTVAPTVFGSTSVAPGGSVTVKPSGLPVSAAVVAASFTVAGAAAGGTLVTYPAGASRPFTPTVVFSAGRPQTSFSWVRTAPSGITLVNTSTAPITVTATAVGYLLAGEPSVAGTLQKVAPAGIFAGTVGAGGTQQVQVSGVATVPQTGVDAAVLLVSVGSATGSGYLNAVAAGAPRSTAPTLPFTSGRPGSVSVVVPLSSAGAVAVRNVSSVAAPVRVEIVGYVLGSSRLTWAPPVQVNTQGSAQYGPVSCVSATFCLAGEGTGFFVRWDGKGWSRLDDRGSGIVPALDGYFTVTSVSCVSQKFCASTTLSEDGNSVGSGLISFWNGTTWNGQDIPDWGARAVTCPTTTFCMASPDGISSGYAVWNGSAWAVAPTPERDFLWDVPPSCPVAGRCFALHQGTLWAFAAGAWSSAGAAPLTNAELSCASVTFCLAVGDTAAGRQSFVFDGSRWSGGVNAPVAGIPHCSSATFCLTADATTTAVFSGSAWSTSPAPLPGGVPEISCTAAEFCGAVADNRASTWSGSWRAPSVLSDDPEEFDRISCGTDGVCVAADRLDAHVLRPGGPTTTTALGTPLDSPVVISALSCASASFCLATVAGQFSAVFTFDGSTWAESSIGDPSDHVDIRGLSCTGPTFCTAVGDGTYRWDGATWTRTSDLQMSLVSCSGPTSCVATGRGSSGGGTSATWDGSRWNTPKPMGDATGGPAVSLACRAGGLCFAVDGAGRVSALQAGTWSAPAKVVGASPVVAVSCSSFAVCVVVTADGKVSQNKGVGWAAPVVVDTVGRPRDISCGDRTFCAVVDDTGKVVRATT
ncbi:hypothetical protein JL107_07195 [Nakamurella flavida]|uniref:Uncharacterized protein n=1 Tax=Nakamurella flavida TaxID=363630 RepID=A0A938YEK1_9ACTN|nr:hypothetical protein [Nakamurella flavida]MBM9476226.1 hypothetical protein [Nakamurella flavida]MDP9779676.1 hypothetical protein [Nakamurella flavida]